MSIHAFPSVLLRTPTGDFRLALNHGCVRNELDKRQLSDICFFASYEIECYHSDIVDFAVAAFWQLEETKPRGAEDGFTFDEAQALGKWLEYRLRSGAILATEEHVSPLPARWPLDIPTAPPEPPPPPRRKDSDPVSFELSFVDEFGAPIQGATADVLFSHCGNDEVKTATGSGTARLDKNQGSRFASARVADNAAIKVLRDAVTPIWNQQRRVQLRRKDVIRKEDKRTSIVVFRSRRPLRKSQAPSPEPVLLCEFELVSGLPHRVSLQPYVELARLRGFYFDTNKCFLLPSAVPDLGSVVSIFERNRGTSVLIVGHTDTSGEDEYNETLSVERAESLAAYLQDRVDAWMEWYDAGKPTAKRWGWHEDSLMISSLSTRGLIAGPNAVLSYQCWHNALVWAERAPNWGALSEDGIIGPKTRAQLIGDYMHHDRTSLDPSVPVTAHGCGEYFPLDAKLEEIDPHASDSQNDPTDRRVEVFFFDRELGIQPPPPGKVSKRGSAEYPEWRARAKLCSTHVAKRGPIIWRYDSYCATATGVQLLVVNVATRKEHLLSPSGRSSGVLEFDLSVLDRRGTYDLTPVRGERKLLAACRVQLAALSSALSHDDTASVAASYDNQRNGAEIA